MLDLAVLISGAGRTLQNLLEQIQNHALPARISVVLSSNPEAGGLQHARKAGIPVVTVSRKGHETGESFSQAVTGALEPYAVDYVVMAGFLHLWKFPPSYRNRVLNIHPALLPEFGGRGFYGRRVHEAVLASGAKESGCTVHFADGEYDHGPVLLQRRIPIHAGETPESLAARVFEQECIAYPEVLRNLAAQKNRPKVGAPERTGR